MKKITFLLFMFMIGFINAQDKDTKSNPDSDKLTFTKGCQFTNLNLSIVLEESQVKSTGITDESDRFGYSIIPSYAYAISDNWFLGLGLGIARGTIKTQLQGSPESKTTARELEILPFTRYYKGIGKQLAFFIQGEARFTTQRIKIANSSDRKDKIFFLGIRPGFVFAMSKNIALEASVGALGYTTENFENNRTSGEANTNRFSLSLDSSNFLFGLSYYF